MRVVQPAWEVYWTASGFDMLKTIERAGRTAYKSEASITETSAEKFVAQLINRGHFSVIEHVSVSDRIICDRGVSHELVRHRIASYTQESTRFCNYSKSRFGSEIAFVLPSFLREKGCSEESKQLWTKAMEDSEQAYLELLKSGRKPEEARSVLPNSLKTEIFVTMNLRE